MRRLLFVSLALVGAVIVCQPAHADHQIEFDQGFKVKNRCGERFYLRIYKNDGESKGGTVKDGEGRTFMFDDNTYWAHNAGGKSTYFYRDYRFVPSKKGGDDVPTSAVCTVTMKYTTNDNLNKVSKHEFSNSTGGCGAYEFSNDHGKTMIVTVKSVPYK